MTTDELLEQLAAAHATLGQQRAAIEQLKVRMAELEQPLDEARRRGNSLKTTYAKQPRSRKARPKPTRRNLDRN